MNNYREWIIRYHGNLKKALQGTHAMMDIINERYAIITIRDEQISYLRALVQIECMEESRPINEIPWWIDPKQMISMSEQRVGVGGEGIRVGWIGHKMNIDYNNYSKPTGGTRILCMHDGIRQYNTEHISSISRNQEKHSVPRSLSPMDMCIGNGGVASDNDIVLINWQKDRFYTADTIRALRFIIERTHHTQMPLVIYFPFDISKESSRHNKLMEDIVSEMALWGKIDIVSSLDDLLDLLIPAPMIEGYRIIDLPYELAPEDGIIDAIIVYNSFSVQETITKDQNVTIFPLVYPYFGVRGTVRDIQRIFTQYLGKTTGGFLSFVAGNQPLNITQANFKAVSILKSPVNFQGNNTLIGIIDTGIDYTNPAFIGDKGETRIVSIWDQTIGSSSPYGYGTVYDQAMINTALKSTDPFEVVPHKDEWGHGTILAGIAAGSGKYADGTYKGIATGAELVIVKLKTTTPTMQGIYYSEYTPLAFSALDIALAVQYLADLANLLQKPISICIPSGTNSGSHDGTNILESIITTYGENPGICTVLSAGDEANKGHHASGNLKEEQEQQVKLTFPKGEGGFVVEIWAMFGDRLEVSLTTPRTNEAPSYTVQLNEAQTHQLEGNSFISSGGSVLDRGTGCQVIRFRTENPVSGEWIINIKGITVIDGRYNIWIPKTGMILPETVLTPASPFTTIYNASSSSGVITVGCHDKRALGPCPSSGRGPTRDDRIKPDFLVEGVDIPGPLPDNKWGLITGTSPASAITAGICSLVYEEQIINGVQLANTAIMRALLVERLKREPTISYPNPSRGYGLLDINSILFE